MMKPRKIKNRERAVHRAFQGMVRHCNQTGDGKQMLLELVRACAQSDSTHPFAPVEMMAREMLGREFIDGRPIRRGPTPVSAYLSERSCLTEIERRGLEEMLDAWDDLEVGIGCTAMDPAKIRVDGGPSGSDLAHERVLGGRIGQGKKMRVFMQAISNVRVGGAKVRDYLDPGEDPHLLANVMTRVLRQHVSVAQVDRELQLRKGTVAGDLRWAMRTFAEAPERASFPPSCQQVVHQKGTQNIAAE